MTDELTPEEKDAFKDLPRERVPAGLEERVVGAMREHGFLARRRRVIELTGSRVAGILAASVALIIGAYSIGLHRGGSGDALAPVATVPQFLERAEAPEETRAPSRTAADVGETEDVAAAAKKDVAESKEQEPPAPATPAVRPGEASADRDDLEPEALARERSEVSAPAALSESPRAASKAGRVQPPSAPLDATLFEKQSLTIVLDGSPLTVEADSVRVTEDERGRILIIYTSDGVIRIRLAG